MKRSLLIIGLTLLLAGLATVSAQVRGISYTIAPAAEYTWYNNRSGLDEAFQVGGMLGIGFGEFVELRALYAQTINQTIDLGAFEVDEGLLDNSDVELSRYGGELKLNLSRGNFLPFLTVGAGVQDIGRTDLESSQTIYASAGLGLTLSASDRFTFNLEGKNLSYSYDAISDLLSEAERQVQNLGDGEFTLERFGNWSVGANLQFYLGGRRPGELSAVDEAYLDAFGKGGGFRLPLEVNLARVDFDDALPYRDTWLGGGNIGVDIGPYIGLRAFYLRAMQEDQVQLDFDPLAMYGGNIRLNLNPADRGIRPYLTLGGGYLDVDEGYVGREDQTVTSQGFATGGAGLVLGLGKTVQLNGSVKSLLISDVDIENLNTTSQLSTSWMYTTGLQFTIGGDRTDPEAVVEARIESELEAQRERLRAEMKEQERANQRERERLKQRYEQRIVELEEELNRAYNADTLDVELTVTLLQQIEQADSVLTELDRRGRVLAQKELRQEIRRQDSIDILFPDPYAPRQMPSPQPAQSTIPATVYERGLVLLSPEQLNQLLERVTGTPNRSEPANRAAAIPDTSLQRRIQRLNVRVARLEGTDAPATPASETASIETRLDSILTRLNRVERALRGQPATRTRSSAAAPADSTDRQIRESLQQLEARLRAIQQSEPEPDSTDILLRENLQQLERRLEATQEAATEPDSTEIRLRQSIQELEERLREAEQTQATPDSTTIGLRENIRQLEGRLAQAQLDSGPDSTTVAELRELRTEIQALQAAQREARSAAAQREVAAPADTTTANELRELREEIRTLRDLQQRRSASSDRNDASTTAPAEEQRRSDRELRAALSELTKEIRELRAEQNDYQDRLDALATDRTGIDYDELAAAIRRGSNETTVALIDDDMAAVTLEQKADTAARRQVRDLKEIEIERSGDYLADTSRAPTNIAYTGLSSFVGFNLGENDNNTLNFGLRWHYNLGPSGYFQFVPETFFGIGSPTNFGIFANGIGIVSKNILGAIRPYGGAGFGFMQMADGDTEDPDDTDFRPAFNLIFGTYLNVLGGRLYVDFTARNLFANNQVVAGYRFTF